MKFLVLIIISALCLSACEKNKENLTPIFNPEELAYIHDHPVITYGLLMDHPPIVFAEDGKPTGVSIDYMNLVQKKTGIKFELRKRGQVPDLISAIKTCEVQFLPGFRATPERVLYMNFSDPFISVGTEMILPIGVENIESASRIGAARGYAVLDFFKKDAASVLQFPNNQMVVQGVLDKKIDGGIMTQPSAAYQLEHIKDGDKLHSVPVPWTHYFSFAICKDDNILTSIFNESLRSITISEKKAIEDKWHIKEVK